MYMYMYIVPVHDYTGVLHVHPLHNVHDIVCLSPGLHCGSNYCSTNSSGTICKINALVPPANTVLC